MNMSELNDAERSVLIDLLAQLVLVDGDASFEEIKELEEIADELGHDSFDEALSEARGKAREDVLVAAASVERPGARELIKTVLHDLASVDGVADGEAALLEEVAALWRA